MRLRLLTGVVTAVVLGTTIPTGVLLGQERAIVSVVPSGALKKFLRSYLGPDSGAPDRTTRFTVVTVKTREMAAEEQIVYVSGWAWCGSGGCTLLILEPTDSSFKVLGRVTIVRLPVRLLHTMNHGHPDIGVLVQGGGVQAGYEAVLSFDGVTYPENPSVPPARPVTSSLGKEIITEITQREHSFALYD